MDSPPAKPDLISPFRDWARSLSSRLFGITLAAILLIEAIIFVPSLGNLRQSWLNERVEAARIAALALDAAPTRMVSEELSQSLLESAAVLGVAEIEDEMRFQLLAPRQPVTGPMRVVDMQDRSMTSAGFGALREFFAPEDEVLLLIAPGSAPGRTIEVLVPQAPMKAGVMAFAWRIAGLSFLIAFIAALVIYVMLRWSVVQPIRRVTMSVEQFSRDPGSWVRRLPPTRRTDEIGRAQNALAGMEEAVAEAFRQRAHLAELGSAVAKINHDLRNSLAAAQLVSDTLARSDDPRVKRAAPRLERALERAIDLATATLDYGKAAPRAPRWQTARLAELVRNAAEEALIGDTVGLEIQIPEALEVLTDPDHLHRIAANLMRNAAEAMTSAGTPGATVRVRLDGGALLFADNGPGLPERSRENLFRPFAASTKANGSGLGLVIAHELAEALGGDLVLDSTGPDGTVFRLTLPGLGHSGSA
jgi:signal transduction histidine kinase